MPATELKVAFPAHVTAVVSVNTSTDEPFFELTLDVEADGTVIASTTIPLRDLLLGCLDPGDERARAIAWYELAGLAFHFDYAHTLAHDCGHRIIRLHGTFP